MSGQAQIMSAEVVGAVRARSATLVALPDALRYFVLYALSGVLVCGVVTFGTVEPWSLFGFQAMAAGLLVRITRVPGQRLIRGNIWVDDVKLVPKP